MHEGSHIKRFSRMLQQLHCDGGCVLAKRIAEYVIKLEVGNSEAVLRTVFLSRHAGREFDPVAAEVSKLPDVFRRSKAASNEVVLEQFGDPLSVFLAGFLPFDGFDELRVAGNYMAGILQNNED